MKKNIFIFIIIICLLLTGCKSKEYTVTFMDEDKVLDSVTVKKGDNIKDIDIPKKNGYIFVSWSKDGISYDSDKPINDDITLTANWVEEPVPIKNYTVTFNYGEYVKTQTVREGELAVRPEKDPKKDKHDFIGWYVGEYEYDFNMPVTKDIVIMAKYEKNRVIITYELDGGTGLKQIEINKGSIPDRPKNPSKFGYDFVGWTIDNEGYNFDKPINKDTTIKANYEATVYIKITFDSNGGNEVNTKYIPSGSKLNELPIPIKEGYTFKYWAIDNKEFDKNISITKDITLIAIYEDKEELPKEE